MSMQFNTSSHLQYPEFSSSVRHKTSKSIAHHLPMNYREYQEMRGGSTRASTKNLDFYNNNFESSASLARNARYSLRNENTNHYPSGFRRSELPDDRDTPFFTASATSVKGSREIGFGFKESNQQERSSSHQRLEGHYRNLVQMTINQVDKLKAKKEELCKQQDQIKKSEDEVLLNYEKRMVELHEKYQDAMKKLQEYFDNSMTKVHEANSQKKSILRAKFNENRYLISELSSAINAVENKIQLLSMSQFIEIFDDEYTEIDKIFNRMSKTELTLTEQFFAFPKAPTFQVIIDDNPATFTQSQPFALPDDFSIGMSLVRNEDMDSLGTTSRTLQLTSPTAAHLNKENNQEGANFQCSPMLKSSNYGGKKSHEAIRIEDGGLDSSLNPKKSRKPTASSTFESDKSNLENTQPIQNKDKMMTEAEKQQKKSTYKEVIKKLQSEGKEKDQIIQDMIKSYKELENKYYKELRDLKPKKTSSLSSPQADDGVLKSISNTMHHSRMTPHSSTSSLTQSKNKRPSSISKQRAPLDPRSTNEAFASFTEVDKEYDEYKKNLENKQRIQWIDEKASETTKNQSLKSSMSMTEKENPKEKKCNVTVRFSDLPKDPQESNIQGTMIDEIKFGGDSQENIKKVAIYIPFGQPVYSNYYAANLQKNTSVDEILQGLLIQLGMNDSRAYRYYLAIKTSENQPDKTLLSSENVYEHLGSECDKKLNSWPRLYLRSYDNKFSQS